MGEDNKTFRTLKRRKSRIIRIGKVFIGGGLPVVIQGMIKIKTSQVEEAIKQIKELEDAGAQIVRLAIKDEDDAYAVREIKKAVDLPLVADIHFDYKLAIKVIENGIDKIRLNPGNIFQEDKIKNIVELAKRNNIPIRVGLNSGSLRGLKYHSTVKDVVNLMLKEAKNYLNLLENFGFYDIVVSLKTSEIESTIQAYEKMAKLCDYPFHLGLTATGEFFCGIVSSSIALGILLREGIGDTIRVSLTDSAVKEVMIARYILENLGLYKKGPRIISCPTCGRCEIELIKMVQEFSSLLEKNKEVFSKPITIAIMGCVVNGPGEARQADLGVAFGKKEGLLFKKGRPYRKVNFKDSLKLLFEEVKKIN